MIGQRQPDGIGPIANQPCLRLPFHLPGPAIGIQPQDTDVQVGPFLAHARHGRVQRLGRKRRGGAWRVRGGDGGQPRRMPAQRFDQIPQAGQRNQRAEPQAPYRQQSMRVAPHQPTLSPPWPRQKAAPPALVDDQPRRNQHQQRYRQGRHQGHAIARGQKQMPMRVAQPALKAEPGCVAGDDGVIRVDPYEALFALRGAHQGPRGKVRTVGGGDGLQRPAGSRRLRGLDHVAPACALPGRIDAHGGLRQPVQLG
ncbi:hypothetical protein D3C71_1462560 [compost metagenome]